LVCEEGIYEVDAISNLLIPLSSKIILTHKPQKIIEKIWMYCTNYYKTNHNVQTYRVKWKEDFLVHVVSEVTTQYIKVQKPMKYSYHIYGDIGHNIINCPKYNDIHNMFKNKGVKIIDKQACGRTQGCKSFSSYGGCQYGDHQ
jgi:hypothetical protein